MEKIGPTANPFWYNAETSTALVPVINEVDDEADLFARLVGKFVLTQGDVAGQRLEEVWLDWQEKFVRSAFQAQSTFLLQGKGSGKSTIVAAMSIGMLMYCKIKGIHHRGLIAILAPTISSAKVVFDHSAECILADEELRPQFKFNVQSRSLIHVETGIVIQILACDMSSAVGRRPIMLICDELHEIGTINAGESVVDQLERGGRNFGTAFKTIMISTMSLGQPKGVFKKRLDYARKVRDGEIDDPTHMPVLFEFPVKERPDLSVDDPEQWWRGMPSLTTDTQRGTMDAAMLEKELRDVTASGDQDAFRMLLSQRLGIQSDDLAKHAESPLHANWHTAPIAVLPHDWSNISQVAIGIDVGGSDDPAAACFMRKFHGGEYHAEVRQFLTNSGYERAGQNLRDVYDEALEDGSLTLVGEAGDIDIEIANWAKLITSTCPIGVTIGGDEHGRVGAKQALEYHSGHTFVSVSQGSVTIGAALAALENLLVDMKLSRAPSALLDANVLNSMIIETPSGLRRIGKKDGGLSGQGQMKIDGLASLIDALHLVNSTQELPADISHWIA